MFRQIGKYLSAAMVLSAFVVIPAAGEDTAGARNGITGFEVEYLESEFHHIVGILPDPSGQRLWIVYEWVGLGLLDEPSQGQWRIILFRVGGVLDGAGPDSSGRIYLTGHGPGNAKGIYIFNCNTLSSEGFYPLGECQSISNIALSTDETRLYVTAHNWPVIGEGFMPGDEHPDTGILWEVDKESLEILREVTVGQEASFIHVSPGGTILVDTEETRDIEIDDTEAWPCGRPDGSLTDVIDIISFERTLRILSGPESGRFFQWSEDGILAAQCSEIIMDIPGHPEYLDGIWVYDTEIGRVVDTIAFTDDSGAPCGIVHGVVSRIDADTVYVAVSLLAQIGYYMPTQCEYNFMAIDGNTHELIAGIELDIFPVCLSELDDGRIVVAGDGNIIAIIEPY